MPILGRLHSYFTFEFEKGTLNFLHIEINRETAIIPHPFYFKVTLKVQGKVIFQSVKIILTTGLDMDKRGFSPAISFLTQRDIRYCTLFNVSDSHFLYD